MKTVPTESASVANSWFATPNIGLLTDLIACPGGDFCALANAKSIPVAEAIQERFDDLDYLHDIGELDLNISGCINACGHHHVGHIGILGVDKQGDEFYQITLGGSSADDASIGKIIGPAFSTEQVVDAVETILFRDGRLTEASASNVFVVKGGVILSPPKSNLILPGITYDVIAEIAQTAGLPLEYRDVSESEVRSADEIWVTSSSKEVLAIVTLDGKPVPMTRPAGKHLKGRWATP